MKGFTTQAYPPFMLASVPLNITSHQKALFGHRKKTSLSMSPPIPVSVRSLCENCNNIKLAAGLIAASWHSSQTQSTVDGGYYREKLERGEKELA